MVHQVNKIKLNEIYTPEKLKEVAGEVIKREFASLKGKDLSPKEAEAALKVAEALTRMIILGEA